MVIENPVIPRKHLLANLDLYEGLGDAQSDDQEDQPKGPRALDVFKACVEAMTEAGIAVIPNNHITNA